MPSGKRSGFPDLCEVIIKVARPCVHRFLRFGGESELLQDVKPAVTRILQAAVRWVLAKHLVPFAALCGVGDALAIHLQL